MRVALLLLHATERTTMSNTTDCYKDNPIRSYVEDELNAAIEEYASEMDMKKSSAIRRLVKRGLAAEREQRPVSAPLALRTAV